MTELREYRDTDAATWLRCRLLSVFGTEYDDAVVALVDAWTRGVRPV